MSKVYLSRVWEYDTDEIKIRIEEGIEKLGGFDQFFTSGDKVLLKPNLLSAKSPERNITTHPVILEAVIDILRKRGVEPYIGDSPGGAHKGVMRVFRETGLKELADRKEVELVNYEVGGVKTVRRKGYTFKISKAYLQFDKVINLPKFKTHSLTLLTGAIKNMFGVIPGFVKTGYHKQFPFPTEFSRFIANLYDTVKDRIVLNIMDGIWGMEGNGPSSGESVNVGYLIVSADGVAMDIVEAKLMGYKIHSIDMIKEAIRLGAGEGEDTLELLGEPLIPIQNFKRAANTHFLNYFPRPIAQFLSRLIYIRPEVNIEKCTGCGMCYRSCPEKAIIMKDGIPTFDYSKCIVCLCCHELCPEKAIELKKSFGARLVGR